jgi:ribosomal protein L19
MSKIIQDIDTRELERLGKKIPSFSPGDTVSVHVTVVEGGRKRLLFARSLTVKAWSASFRCTVPL